MTPTLHLASIGKEGFYLLANDGDLIINMPYRAFMIRDGDTAGYLLTAKIDSDPEHHVIWGLYDYPEENILGRGSKELIFKADAIFPIPDA